MTAPIVHRNITVLQLSEPAMLDEIRVLLPIDRYVLARISETELVIDPARTGELAGRLAEAGLQPLVRKARAHSGR